MRLRVHVVLWAVHELMLLRATCHREMCLTCLREMCLKQTFLTCLRTVIRQHLKVQVVPALLLRVSAETVEVAEAVSSDVMVLAEPAPTLSR